VCMMLFITTGLRLYPPSNVSILSKAATGRRVCRMPSATYCRREVGFYRATRLNSDALTPSTVPLLAGECDTAKTIVETIVVCNITGVTGSTRITRDRTT
jgi:hypothetical protein